MQKCGCGRLQDTKDTKDNQAGIESDDILVVPMDSLLQAVTDLLEGDQIRYVIPHEDNICDLACDLCAITDSNPYICGRKRRRIIDTIAYHDNGTPLGLFVFYKGCLIFRQNFRIELVNADLCGNGFCRLVTISCHHDNLGNTKFF